MNPYIQKILSSIRTLWTQGEVALDVGTSVTRIAIAGKGIVLREPTYLGLNTKSNQYIFFGEEAKEIYGKAPDFIKITKPVEHAIISDFDSTVTLLHHFLDKSVVPFYFNSRLIKSQLSGLTATPTSSTEVEQKAIIEAVLKTHINKVSLIEKPIATAYGADLPVFSKNPNFIIDLGGGLIEIAVIIMGGIVVSKTLRMAGEQMDRVIINYLHLKNGIIIGEPTAELLKTGLFSLNNESETMTVRGKSLENGLPKSIRVKSAEIREALIGNIIQITDSVKELLETIPPEIVDGIIKSGVTLTGGLANIKGLDAFMTAELKIPVYIADNPADATIRGTLKLLSEKNMLDRIMIK